MEFEVRYAPFSRNRIDSHIDYIVLDSNRIVNETYGKPFIDYCVKVAGYSTYCSVTTEPYDNGKYLINFYTFESIEGKALEEFKEYLKENHKKNIMELII